ncbi:hypothetical protein BDQ17DRAFT_872730 [Cyathus striatus]|nr:hypothetical protein BDQ17DRAFT_872730 [Cyathus striatus]
MAPSFLSKFVKAATPTSSRERSSRDRSLDSPRSSVSPSPLPRNRSSSTPTARNSAEPATPPPVPPIPAGLSGSAKGKGEKGPSITVAEPPVVTVAGGSSSQVNLSAAGGEEEGQSHRRHSRREHAFECDGGSSESPGSGWQSALGIRSDHDFIRSPAKFGWQFILSAAPKRRTTSATSTNGDATPTHLPPLLVPTPALVPRPPPPQPTTFPQPQHLLRHPGLVTACILPHRSFINTRRANH